MFIIFCYFFIKSLSYKKYLLKENIFYINNKFLLLTFVTAITFLTGYYTIIYICLFGLFIIYNDIKIKKFTETKYYFLILAAGFILAQFLYQKFFRGFISYRVNQAGELILTNFFDNIKLSFIMTIRYLKIHFFLYPIILICLACPVYQLIQRKNPPPLLLSPVSFYIFIVSLIFSIIVMIVAPFKVVRYIAPVFPFLIFLPVIFINTLQIKKVIKYLLLLFILIILFINALNINKIDHLFIGKPQQYKFTQFPDIPVVINYNNFFYAEILPYINNSQIYYLINDYAEINSLPYDEFYLVIDIFWYHENIDLSNFVIIDEFEIDSMLDAAIIHNWGYFLKGIKLKK